MQTNTVWHPVLWFSLWDVYQYQPISHSVLLCSLCNVYRYQHISHSVLWCSLCNVYRYQPISHSVLWFSLFDVYRKQPITHSVLVFITRRISLSAHITLCAVFFTIGRRPISVSAYITLYYCPYFSWDMGKYRICLVNKVFIAHEHTLHIVYFHRKYMNTRMTMFHVSAPDPESCQWYVGSQLNLYMSGHDHWQIWDVFSFSTVFFCISSLKTLSYRIYQLQL